MISTRISIFKSTRKSSEKQLFILSQNQEIPRNFTFSCYASLFNFHYPLTIAPSVITVILWTPTQTSSSSCTAMVYILRPPLVTVTNTLLMASSHLFSSSPSHKPLLLQISWRDCEEEIKSKSLQHHHLSIKCSEKPY